MLESIKLTKSLTFITFFQMRRCPTFHTANSCLLCLIKFPLETLLARESYGVVGVMRIVFPLFIAGLRILNTRVITYALCQHKSTILNTKCIMKYQISTAFFQHKSTILNTKYIMRYQISIAFCQRVRANHVFVCSFDGHMVRSHWLITWDTNLIFYNVHLLTYWKILIR